MQFHDCEVIINVVVRRRAGLGEYTLWIVGTGIVVWSYHANIARRYASEVGSGRGGGVEGGERRSRNRQDSLRDTNSIAAFQRGLNTF